MDVPGGGHNAQSFASPIIDPVDGTIYVGSSDDLLHAFNPDGTEKWHFPSSGTIGTIEGAPTISTETLAANRRIYIGSNDNKVHAVNRSGAPSVDPYPPAVMSSPPPR